MSFLGIDSSSFDSIGSYLGFGGDDAGSPSGNFDAGDGAIGLSSEANSTLLRDSITPSFEFNAAGSQPDPVYTGAPDLGLQGPGDYLLGETAKLLSPLAGQFDDTFDFAGPRVQTNVDWIGQRWRGINEPGVLQAPFDYLVEAFGPSPARLPVAHPPVSYKAPDPDATPWSIGKTYGLTGDEYDLKYGIVRNQDHPVDTVITDSGPTLAQNIGTVFDAASLGATGYLGLVGAPTAAVSGLSKLAGFSHWLAPSTINSVAQTSKWAAAAILGDSVFDFGTKINGVLEQKETLRTDFPDLANFIVGGNYSLPLKIGGVGFDGISISGFLSNASSFDGKPDADGNTIYHDASWGAIGFRPKNNNAFVGVINGLKGLETGPYLRAVATSPHFSTAGTAKSLYINVNPLSDNFLDHYDMIDQYLVNSNVPKKPGNFSYSLGWYQKYDSDARGRLTPE